jgi:TolA-binding protein
MKRLALLGSFVLAVAALAPVSVMRSAAQSSEELARRQYDSGLAFLRNGRYAEALKDFDAVVGSFPQSAVADDALLQIALYQLDVARDLGAAQAAADRLLKDYPASDSAPMAYVVSGRTTIARSRAPAAVDAALATFERVSRLFPNSAAVAAARFYAGELLRATHRPDDAARQYRSVVLEHPASIWAARANLSTAANLVASDRAADAFRRLQRIREQFPDSPEAAAALNLNTIIYRLVTRKPPYAFAGRQIGGEKERFRDVVGLTVDEGGRILVGHKQGVSIYQPNGSFVRQVAASDPSAFFAYGRDRVVVVRREVLLPEKMPPISIQVPTPGKVARQVEEVRAALALSTGEWLVADRKAKTVLRVTPDGKFIANFAGVDAEKMTRNELDEVAMIDRSTNSVVVVDRDGKALTRIAPKTAASQLEDPVDVAFDALGNLYVLDGRKGTIQVFGQASRLLATIAFPAGKPGTLQRPRALALDAAARLYVYDESSQRIQVYQ